MMWLHKILNWFSQNKNQTQLIIDFNKKAKESFINNQVPVFMKAEISKGNSSYKHKYSNFWRHGFRIRIISGLISENEIIDIGSLIINDIELRSRLIYTGYDTLEIESIYGNIIREWKLTELLEIR